MERRRKYRNGDLEQMEGQKRSEKKRILRRPKMAYAIGEEEEGGDAKG